MREAALTTAFALIPALSGALSTYLYEDDAPLLWRVAAGSCCAFAALGLVAFVAAFALPIIPVLNLVWLTALGLVGLLLAADRVRKAAWHDVQVATRRLRAAKPSLLILSGISTALSAAVAWAVLDRVLVVRDDGLHTGIINNFGDLPFHMGVIARFAAGTNVPPESPIFAGVPFTYPFLADFLTALPVAAGASIRQAMLAQNFVLLCAFCVLVHQWAFHLTRDRLAAAFSCGLVIMSGGLGWWMLLGDVQNGTGFVTTLLHLNHDYTVMGGTPWRWGNVVTALLVTQRSLLLGLPVALVVLTLIYREISAAELVPARVPRRMIAAGLLTGLLPLVHAHTFMVIVGMAACLSVWFGGFRRWCAFFAASLVLAVPQLLWSAHQTATNMSNFVGWQIGWDRGAENPLSFWLRNTGAFIPLLVTAFAWPACRERLSRCAIAFYAPFTLCFLVPNVMRLAPWIWDNIKVLVYWFIASAPFVALVLVQLWRRRSVFRLLAGAALVSLTMAGALDIWRVASSAFDARLFDEEGIAFAEHLRGETSARALILHAPVHNHPVFLSGRRSFMGFPGQVWSHGLNEATRLEDIRQMYNGSAHARDLLQHMRSTTSSSARSSGARCIRTPLFSRIISVWNMQVTSTSIGSVLTDTDRPPTRTHLDPTWWWIAAAWILILAALLRFYDLDLKPLHHDEGVNGFFLVNLIRSSAAYRYDPSNYHGPDLYYFARASVALFGLSTVAIRFVPALFGAITVWLLLTWRAEIGAIGSLVAAALVALSPGAVYMSRYFIHEALLVCFTLAAVVALARYKQSKRTRDLVLAGSALAFMFATKETAIISVGVASVAVVMTVLLTGGIAWFRSLGVKSTSLARTLMLQLAAPFAIFVAIIVVFFSSFFTHLEALPDAVRSFAFWAHTGAGAHVHPWWTYLSWMLREEALILALAVVGAIIAILRRDNTFAVFAALWAIGTLMVNSFVPYKTPWLTLNLIVPLAVIGGYGADELWLRGGRTVRAGLTAFGGVLFTVTLVQSVNLNFVHYDDATYPYVYAHTQRDFLRLVRDVDVYASRSTATDRLHVTVTSRQQFPLSWYLRNFDVGYYDHVITTADPIIIGSEQQDQELGSMFALSHDRQGVYLLRPGVRLVLYVRR